MTEPVEAWARGRDYDVFMGRWSRQVTDGFLTWLNPGGGLRWLDVGCGTGALSAAIAARADPAEVVGVDTSSGYVAYARQRHLDVAVSGLMLNFATDPAPVVASMRDAVIPDGVVATYVWDCLRMSLLRQFWTAAAALDPTARDLTRRCGSPRGTTPGSHSCGTRLGCATFAPPRSPSHCACATSMTTGTPSSADKVQQPATSPHSTTTTRRRCATASANA